MKTLYLDCSMGAAGDMLTAALLELIDNKEAFITKLNSVGLDGVEYHLEKSKKCGITGSHMTVLCHGLEENENLHDINNDGEHHHEHNTLEGIRHIVCDHLNISESAKKSVMGVYNIIADAESRVHGKPVTDIHFHEVGTMDAVADITAVCLLMEEINADKILASPVHVGSGTVKCAHGILPVPAPATANILAGIPVYGGEVTGELCTPTGAALLKYFVKDFCGMPLMKMNRIGYGMGKKDFERANCIRAILGETADSKDDVFELSFNLDDMTPEKIGYATQKLFEAGALDVYTVPVGMKKNRPGTLVRLLCKENTKEKIVQEIFHHTTTIGIREQRMNRYCLDRSVETIETPWGKVRIKTATGYGTKRSKFEYDDLARIAEETGMSIQEVEGKILSRK